MVSPNEGEGGGRGSCCMRDSILGIPSSDLPQDKGGDPVSEGIPSL